jgi:hypothetical protein
MPDVDSLEQYDKDTFADDVKDRVYAHECLAWEMNMRGKEKLALYLDANEGMDFKDYLKGHLTLGTKLMFRLRSGNVALNGVLAMTDNQQVPSCPCCASDCEDVVHVLVNCPFYHSHRAHYLQCLRDVVGAAAFDAFNAKSDRNKCLCILSVKPWDELHRTLVCDLAKEFMCRVWQSRMQKVNALLTSAGQVTPTLQSGSVSLGDAEVYGQLTMTPNT